ncbi:hypothetical protein BH11ACT6_BH11ACT6_43810 [soil metagenome]
MRHWKALLTVVVIAAAAVVWHDLPVNTEIYAPFDVTAAAGAPVSGRNITATVTGVEIASEIRPENARQARLDASGIWVVVTADVTAIREPGLMRTQLLVGPDTYAQTDRLLPSARLGGLMQPGIVYRGAWVFDVAPAALDAVDTVTLQVWLGDGRLDSRLSLNISVGDVDRVDSVEVPRPVVSAG